MNGPFWCMNGPIWRMNEHFFKNQLFINRMSTQDVKLSKWRNLLKNAISIYSNLEYTPSPKTLKIDHFCIQNALNPINCPRKFLLNRFISCEFASKYLLISIGTIDSASKYFLIDFVSDKSELKVLLIRFASVKRALKVPLTGICPIKTA